MTAKTPGATPVEFADHNDQAWETVEDTLRWVRRHRLDIERARLPHGPCNRLKAAVDAWCAVHGTADDIAGFYRGIDGPAVSSGANLELMLASGVKITE